MSRMRFALIATTVFALIAAGPVEAQFARASVSGAVKDPNGAPLPGVAVTVRNEASGFSRTATTAASGGYVFNGLTPGTYTITFVLQGFRTVERQGVELRVGQEATLNVTLELGGVRETVTVTAQTPMVEVTSKEIGGAITAREFEDLPSQNRSFVLFAALLPGVVPSPDTESTASDSLFINGQDDNNNSFNVDGANNDDDVIGARAGAQTRTAFDAIQEFQILTTQFDAEFGRTQGGVLNAVTKSGGNEVHGTGFFYYQDSSLNEKNFFTERAGLEQPDFTFNSMGGTVGGPIIADRAHYFGSFERQKPEEGVARQFSTRPELDFVTTEDNLIRNWIGKIDWQAARDHKVAFRYLREFSPQFNQIVGNNTTLEASREEDDKDTNLIGSLDSVLSGTAFNNLRASFTREDVAFANPAFNNNGKSFEAQRAASVSQSRPGVLEGNSTVAQARVNNSFQIDDTLSWFLPDTVGDHDWRLGANYSYRTAKFNFSDSANGQFVFDTDRPFDPADITTYPQSFTVRVGGPAGNPNQVVPGYNVVGLFAQDDWQPLENLTLNLGVRWDWEGITEDNDNFGPRLGVTWDPFGRGRTAVRGGWGRFYERMQVGDGGGYSAFFLDAVSIDQGFIRRVPDAGANPQLFFDLAQANGVTTLNGLRDLLVAQIEGGSTALLNLDPTVDNPGRVQPYADTFSVGVEHEVFEGISVGADVVHTENKEIRVLVDLNPFSTALGGRPNISILNGEVVPLNSISSQVNAGESTYDALQLSLIKRLGDTPIGRLSGRVSYTFADQEGNANAGVSGNRFQLRTESGYNFDTGELIGEPLDLNLDDPANTDRPSPWHRDHNFVTSWSWLVPQTSWRDNGGLMVSGIYRWMSGNRFTIQELGRLDNTQRQVSAQGTYPANLASDIALDPIEFDGTENGAEGPDFNRLDVSFRYRVPLRRAYELTLLADFFNVTNEVNFSNIGSSFRTTGAFLIPTAAFAPREFQFGARFAF